MRILITTFGSYGDLHPYMATGIELTRRGHEVTIATSPFYEAKVRSEGLGFHPVRPDVSLDDTALLAYVMDARRGTERILRYLSSVVRDSYEDTVDAAKRADLIVTHPIAFAAVIAAEKFNIPWVSSVLAPISLLSSFDPPVPANAPWFLKARALGPGFMKWAWGLGKRETLKWVRPIGELRRELGLPKGEHPLFEGSHSPRLVLALFSRYLIQRPPDWPPQTVVTGFPFYDAHHEEQPLTAELAKFLESGPAPVVFTLGSSAVGAAGDFYVASLEAVERLGVRAVFLTGPYPQGLPERLPSGVLTVPYAPHSGVFPHAAATVHQGGIGTLAQAMRAGRPMLVAPFGHDQFDNGALVRRLGMAEVLYRSRYNAARAAAMLKVLLESPNYARATAEVGARVRSENGTIAAADAILHQI